jgi:hypothetical protein
VESNSKKLKELQDKVLIGIGRNVVNHQKMEVMLKSLVVLVDCSIPTGDAANAMKKRQKAVSKIPMGRLVDDFVRSVRPKNENDDAQTTESAERTFDFSVRLCDGEFLKELAASLRMVVKERNTPIHKKLIGFNSKSPESCRNLARELEHQHQRIQPQSEALAAISSAVRDGFEELMGYIDSNQFETDTKIAKERAAESI